MTAAEWVPIVASGLAGASSVLVFTASRSFGGGRYLAKLEAQLTTLVTRLDNAGKLQSDLADEVQKLEDRMAVRVESLRGEMRSEYVLERVAAERWTRSEQDRADLRREIDRLGEVIRLRRR